MLQCARVAQGDVQVSAMPRLRNTSTNAVQDAGESSLLTASSADCRSSMICQIQAATPRVRPMKGNAALNICQPACRKVAQRFCTLDTDWRVANSTRALALALNSVASVSLPTSSSVSVIGPLMYSTVRGSTSARTTVHGDGKVSGTRIGRN